MITTVERDGVTLRESRIVLHAGLGEKHTFVQLSDMHLTAEDGSNNELARSRAEFWTIQGGVFRGEQRVYPAEVAGIVCERIREIAPEAVFFTGDTVDYPSVANFRAAKRLLDSLGTRLIFVPGNHDEVGEDAPDELKHAFRELVGEIRDFSVTRLAPGLDAIILDDGHVRVTARQVELVRKQLDRSEAAGERVLILAHAPFLTASAMWPTRKMWGFSWMVGEEASGEDGKAMARLLRERRDVIAAVFAGHIHRESGDGEGVRYGEQYDPDDVRQFTAAPALGGFYRVIEID